MKCLILGWTKTYLEGHSFVFVGYSYIYFYQQMLIYNIILVFIMKKFKFIIFFLSIDESYMCNVVLYG